MSREQFKLRRHERCVELLEMALKAKNRVEDKKSWLARFRALKPYERLGSFYDEGDILKQQIKYENIHIRIMKSYTEVMERLNKFETL
jgi:hypothetical protein